MRFDKEGVIENNITPMHLPKDHLDRYIFAKKYVKGKTVLDLVCGTEYGTFELMGAGVKNNIRSGAQFKSSENINKIKPLEERGLGHTYFILVAKNK